MYYCLIVGSRTFSDYDMLKKRTDEHLADVKEKITIVSGGAKGADSLAKQYAEDKGYNYKEFKIEPKHWERYGKSAGYKRNQQMHSYIAQFENRSVLAFWDGKSKGTQHSFDLANTYHNKLTIIRYN
jgi:hypothetical protein